MCWPSLQGSDPLWVAAGGGEELIPSFLLSGSVQGEVEMSGVSGKVCPEVLRLLNSVVNVCLVYGIDETSSRELEVAGKCTG